MSDNIVLIYKFAYRVNMSVGGDTWGPYGQVENHPNFPNGRWIYPSTPVAYDEGQCLLTTYSGRKYRIMSFDDNMDKTIAYIREDIARAVNK